MKTSLFLLLTCAIVAAHAQNAPCSTLKLTSGMTLVYKTETAPPPTYAFTGTYYKESPKAQQKIREEFYRKNPWTYDVQTNAIQLVPNADGTTEIVSTVQRKSQTGISSVYRAYCKNDTLVNRPGFTLNNNGVVTEQTYYNVMKNPTTGEQFGFSILFEKATPNHLQVGQQLLDQQTMFSLSTSGQKNIQFPKTEEVGREITSYGKYTSTGRWNETYRTVISKFETTMVDAIVEASVSSEALTRNRVVKEQKDVTVSGQTFTAYLISEESWTGGTNFEVKSDNPFVMASNRKYSEKMAKKTAETMREMMGANEEGYLVTYMEYWYIPGIGAYNMTTYNQYHEKIGYLELVEIR